MPALAPEPATNEALPGAPGERLVDTLHRTLVEAIVDGSIGASGRLYPAELAARFGVSATPVREALMRLAAEGCIRAVPRRGFHVRNPTAAEVTELWQVRRGLETLAVELAVSRLAAGTASLDEMRALHRRLEAGRALALREHVALNGRFHEALIALAGNRMLDSLYDAIRVRLLGMWIKRGQAEWRGRLSGDAAEHRAIVAALARHDVAAARAAIVRHIDRSLADALADLAARDGAPPNPTVNATKNRRRT